MDIIGRIEEQKELDSCLKSDKPEFVVVYEEGESGRLI